MAIMVLMKPLSAWLGTDVPRSDTLFGGLCWGIRWLMGEDQLKALLAEFHDRRPPFLVTSVFPVIQRDGQPAFPLLPKPKEPSVTASVHQLVDRTIEKRLKRAQWVSPRVFRELSTGVITLSEIGKQIETDKKYEVTSKAIFAGEEFSEYAPC